MENSPWMPLRLISQTMKLSWQTDSAYRQIICLSVAEGAVGPCTYYVTPEGRRVWSSVIICYIGGGGKVRRYVTDAFQQFLTILMARFPLDIIPWIISFDFWSLKLELKTPGCMMEDRPFLNLYNPGDNDCRVLTLLKPIMSVTYLKAITRHNAYQYQRRKLRPFKKAE